METKIFFYFIIFLIIISGIGIVAYKSLVKVDVPPELIICLDKETTLYSQQGCLHCQKQERIFGDKYYMINDVDCTLNPRECIDNNITETPTWVINGKTYKRFLEMEELKKLTGCY